MVMYLTIIRVEGGDLKMESNQDVLLDKLYKLMRTIRRHTSGSSRGRHSHGEARLLRILERNGGSSSRELAAELDIRPPSISQMLDTLERRGDIERQRDPEDSRIHRIYLTEQGKERIVRVSERDNEIRERLAECLTEDESQIFCDICDKLNTHMANTGGGV